MNITVFSFRQWFREMLIQLCGYFTVFNTKLHFNVYPPHWCRYSGKDRQIYLFVKHCTAQQHPRLWPLKCILMRSVNMKTFLRKSEYTVGVGTRKKNFVHILWFLPSAWISSGPVPTRDLTSPESKLHRHRTRFHILFTGHLCNSTWKWLKGF